MEATTEDFRRAYREMSDEGLLSVNPDELVEVARQCYDSELRARSLTRAATEPAGESGPLDPSEPLVCVAAFFFKRDADLAQSVLESAEVPCFQPNRHMLDIDPALATAVLDGCQVLVPTSYAEQALELLAPMITDANKAIVRRWFEDVWNKGHENSAAEFGAGVDPHLRTALPDLQVAVEEMVAEANKVVARLAVSGTRGGQRVQFHAVVMVRLEGGRIIDTWSMNDAPASLNA